MINGNKDSSRKAELSTADDQKMGKNSTYTLHELLRVLSRSLMDLTELEK